MVDPLSQRPSSYVANAQWQRAFQLIEAINDRDALDVKIKKLGEELAEHWTGPLEVENDMAFSNGNGNTHILHYVPEYKNDNDPCNFQEAHVYCRLVMRAIDV